MKTITITSLAKSKGMDVRLRNGEYEIWTAGELVQHAWFYGPTTKMARAMLIGALEALPDKRSK